MIVIQGKSQKSKVLENLIRKEFLTNKVVVLDSIGVDYWVSDDWATIWQTETKDVDQIINFFKTDYTVFKGFDWVVFYVNANKEDVYKFKELDKEYPQNIILTVQSEAGITNKYYI
ncbi:hypothetical protein AB1L07_02135 [Niallia alba]|uniref:hypothetical protein n=1 Tax=Niallia alba TaxID=2729105 RepID=UPI0039A1807E